MEGHSVAKVTRHEYGVVLLRGALTEEEQAALLLHIPCKEPSKTGKAEFFLSAGEVGSPTRRDHGRDHLHQLGELLYGRVANELGLQLMGAESAEPSLRRLRQVYSGEVPAKVVCVTSYATTIGEARKWFSHFEEIGSPNTKAHVYTMSKWVKKI